MQFYWSDIIASILLASLLYLSIENPILLVDEYFHQKRQEKRKLESGKV